MRQDSLTRLSEVVHRGHVGCDNLLVKVAIAVVIVFLLFLFLAATVTNEGCLPWQERVGYGDGAFGEQQDVSRCSGSWLPFGSALLLVPH